MGNPNILLTRVDNRLVHGQVGMIWAGSLGANLIIVANDEAATDPTQRSLMEMTAKFTEVGIRIFTLQHTADIIYKAAPHQKIFIVARTPGDVLKLVKLGVPIKSVGLGNMHSAPGKRALNKKIYVDDQDMEDIHSLKALGVDVFIQDYPQVRARPVE